MAKLTGKEEAFCQLIAKYGDKKKVKAYKEADYSVNMSEAAIQVQADKLYNKPKLSLRIKELQKTVNNIAKKKFTITVERRLRWLEEIVSAGLATYNDASGGSRRENLAASKGAIETLNTMLGIDENSETKPVKVFIGVEDASKS